MKRVYSRLIKTLFYFQDYAPRLKRDNVTERAEFESSVYEYSGNGGKNSDLDDDDEEGSFEDDEDEVFEQQKGKSLKQKQTTKIDFY